MDAGEVRRGTTIPLIVKVPFDPGIIEVFSIVFEQRGKIVLKKRLEDCEIKDGLINIPLSEKDTLSLIGDTRAKTQVRAKLLDGSLIASHIKEVYIKDILEDGELV